MRAPSVVFFHEVEVISGGRPRAPLSPRSGDSWDHSRRRAYVPMRTQPTRVPPYRHPVEAPALRTARRASAPGRLPHHRDRAAGPLGHGLRPTLSRPHRAMGGAVDPPLPGAWWQGGTVNPRGPFLGAHAVLPGVIARGRGRGVDVASGAAMVPARVRLRGWQDGPALPARNAGDRTQGHGAQCLRIRPGVIHTGMVAAQEDPWLGPRFRQLLEQCADVPLERAATVAGALASGQAGALSTLPLILQSPITAAVRRDPRRLAASPDAASLRRRPIRDRRRPATQNPGTSPDGAPLNHSAPSFDAWFMEGCAMPPPSQRPARPPRRHPSRRSPAGGHPQPRHSPHPFPPRPLRLPHRPPGRATARPPPAGPPGKGPAPCANGDSSAHCSPPPGAASTRSTHSPLPPTPSSARCRPPRHARAALDRVDEILGAVDIALEREARTRRPKGIASCGAPERSRRWRAEQAARKAADHQPWIARPRTLVEAA